MSPRSVLLFACLATLASAQFTLVETGGTFRAGATNLATSGTAIGQDQLELGTHYIVNVNDGVYGNSSSWIGLVEDDTMFGSWVGVRFSSAQTIASLAFGRDNLGGFSDRATGSAYLFQYSSDASVNSNPAGAVWTSFGTLDYLNSPPTDPSYRHLYNINTPLTDVYAIRIYTASGLLDGNAIDEIELYATAATPVPEPSTYATLAGVLALAMIGWRRRAVRR